MNRWTSRGEAVQDKAELADKLRRAAVGCMTIKIFYLWQLSVCVRGKNDFLKRLVSHRPTRTDTDRVSKKTSPTHTITVIIG